MLDTVYAEYSVFLMISLPVTQMLIHKNLKVS